MVSVPTAEQLEDFERDPLQSLLLHHEVRGNVDGPPEETEEQLIAKLNSIQLTPEIRQKIVADFVERVDIEAPICVCAVCGERDVGALKRYDLDNEVFQKLRLNEQQVDDYRGLGYFQKLRSVYIDQRKSPPTRPSTYNNIRLEGSPYFSAELSLPEDVDSAHYWLVYEFVETAEDGTVMIPVCERDWVHLRNKKNKKLPPLSAARDYGHPSRFLQLGLPLLTPLERELICRVRIFALSNATSQPRRLEGHAIAFRGDAVRQVTSQHLPCLKGMSDHIQAR